VHNATLGISHNEIAMIVPSAICERLIALGALTCTVDRRGKTAHWHLLRIMRALFDGRRRYDGWDADVAHYDCVKVSEALSVGAPSDHPIAEAEASGDDELDDQFIHFDYEGDYFTEYSAWYAHLARTSGRDGTTGSDTDES